MDEEYDVIVLGTGLTVSISFYAFVLVCMWCVCHVCEYIYT